MQGSPRPYLLEGFVQSLLPWLLLAYVLVHHLRQLLQSLGLSPSAVLYKTLSQHFSYARWFCPQTNNPRSPLSLPPLTVHCSVFAKLGQVEVVHAQGGDRHAVPLLLGAPFLSAVPR